MHLEGQKNRTISWLFYCWVLMTVLACASTPDPKTITAPPDEIDRISLMKTSEAVSELKSQFNEAENRGLSIFAPEHYKIAYSALQEVEDMVGRADNKGSVVNKIAVTQAVIRSGTNVVKNVKERLKDEIKLKEKLVFLNANDVYTFEFNNVVTRLDGLIRQLENGKFSQVEEARPALIADMRGLQSRAARFNALNEPEIILKRVKRRGGAELIPITYAEAEAVLKSAENFLKANPQNVEAVERIGQQALFAARRALFVSDEVASLQHTIKFSPEQVVLDEEFRLNQIVKGLGDDMDLRDNPLEVQAQKLSETVSHLAKKNIENEKMVGVLRKAVEKGEGADEKFLALNEEIKKLYTEKNTWEAREALYKARVLQLNTELEAQRARVAVLSSGATKAEVLIRAKSGMDSSSEQAKPVKMSVDADTGSESTSSALGADESQVERSADAELASEKESAEELNKKNEGRFEPKEDDLSTEVNVFVDSEL